MIKQEDIVRLYKQIVTQIPPYIEKELQNSLQREAPGSLAHDILEKYLENVRIARAEEIPICQDTGIPKFLIKLPKGYSRNETQEIILNTIPIATKEAYARNSGVDSLTGKQTGNEGIVTIYFDEWEREYPQLSLLLKGGGSENAGLLFSLPDPEINARRDTDGVKRCVEYVIEKKVVNACPPVIVTVGIGGTRDKSIEISQRLLFRPWGQRNADDQLRNLEKELYDLGNASGIGPQGFGGKTTVLDVRVDKLSRHIATYFVDVSVNCWVYRMGNLSYENEPAKFFW